ncbi:hypothetical protein PRIPAC_91806 [Pristionchus pacificus]|uniref:Uncharacterized protein n=1 Tax=Pristionchus pacificus TaxID=54126 RepID=A0A2A6BQZ9_PRIPA|nr:hypothetical protein PRIPAC_91806 [Pristionchus pacificus]|eukprot:PDM68307.1 hypothetical protein PRIPAC_46351 [Pristionchus pacificus]
MTSHTSAFRLFGRFVIAIAVILFVIFMFDWTKDSNVEIIRYIYSSSQEENMQFTCYDNKKASKGKSFPRNLTAFIDYWKISDIHVYKLKPINSSGVVFITYASSNHFHESRKAVSSLRSAYRNKIVFYDLGLTAKEATEMANVCNLEMWKFDYSKYPSFVTQLFQYHFKAIIMAEAFSQFESYWIMDASIRFNNHSSLHDFYSKFLCSHLHFSISSGKMETLVQRFPASHSILATTHPGMYDYLPINATRAIDVTMRAATVMFITRSDLGREAVKWNVLCALTGDCFAPPGSELTCKFDGPRRVYAHCNRYDQSSINIIIESLLDRDGWHRTTINDDGGMGQFISIQRGDRESKKLSIPCH